ncbi:MAG: hypothetical protein AAF547_17545 [Actinomycetota bacterium]
MPPLYFLHIPKTSGTSLSRYLDANVPDRAILPAKVWSAHLGELGSAGLSPYARSMRRYRLVRGHFGLAARREFSDRPQLVTMVRDPIDRVLSMFHHLDVERVHNNFVPPDFYREPFSLGAVLADERRAVLSDGQVRHLSIDLDVKAMARAERVDGDESGCRSLNLDTIPEFLHPSAPRPELLDVAWNEVRTASWFGVQEYHQAGLLMLAEVLGWPPIRMGAPLMQLDGRQPRHSIDDDVLQAIRDHNRVDATLHRRALALFRQRYAAYASRQLGETVNATDIGDHEPEITARCLQRSLGSGGGSPAESSLAAAAR